MIGNIYKIEYYKQVDNEEASIILKATESEKCTQSYIRYIGCIKGVNTFKKIDICINNDHLDVPKLDKDHLFRYIDLGNITDLGLSINLDNILKMLTSKDPESKKIIEDTLFELFKKYIKK